MSKISDSVTYKEVTFSQTAVSRGIDNDPTETQLELIKECAINVIDHIGKATEGPLKINSCYRSPALNKAIGGSNSSQHSVGLDPKLNSYGAAFDIDDDFYHRGLSKMDNAEMAYFIMENLDYDQCIMEFPDKDGRPSWIHVSYRPDGKNRKQNLIAVHVVVNGKKRTKYLPYKGNENLIKKKINI